MNVGVLGEARTDIWDYVEIPITIVDTSGAHSFMIFVRTI